MHLAMYQILYRTPADPVISPAVLVSLVGTREIMVVSGVKPLSQLAHDHFNTLCDSAFWRSHDGSPTLHELSLPLHAIFRSPAVASDFWACLKFRGDRVRRFLSHWVSRSLVQASYNVVCARKSGATTFEVVRWFACLDASVVQPWDCCSTCGMWSCNVVLPLHDY